MSPSPSGLRANGRTRIQLCFLEVTLQGPDVGRRAPTPGAAEMPRGVTQADRPTSRSSASQCLPDTLACSCVIQGRAKWGHRVAVLNVQDVWPRRIRIWGIYMLMLRY